MPSILHRQEIIETTGPPQPPPEDHYASLVNVVAEAANDPARVRKLVYAVVRSNLDPERVFAPSMTDATWQARTLSELDQAFQIERAIRRLEERTAPRPAMPPVAPAVTWPPGPFEAAFDDATAAAVEPLPAAPEPPSPAEPLPVRAALLALEAVARELPAKAAAPPAPERYPAWLVPAADAMVEPSPLARPQRLWAAWATLPTHVHVVAAALVAAALVTGLSGALPDASPAGSATAKALRPAVSVALKGARISETVGHAAAQPADGEPAPLPMPRDLGVYAAHDGLLTRLDPLPVTLSAASLRAAAAITRPSRTVLAGDRLSFVVFDRDFADGAPQSVSARVVGRVSRLVQYVEGRARATRIAGSWRVRDKTYPFKVTALSDRDILVIRPDAGTVLPAGRYALVLNGRGYDFSVAGPVTAPEQCLEQTEVVNGAVIGNCTNI
jgi:hypothetical protein